MSNEQSELTKDLRDGTLWVTFNRPAARNALTFAMYSALADICATAGAPAEC